MTAMNLDDLNGKVIIKVAGEDVEVHSSDTVKETLKNLLQEKGIDSFTILVDGDEILSTDDLPKTFGDCDSLEVQKNVKVG